jgi:hypothetical protein
VQGRPRLRARRDHVLPGYKAYAEHGPDGQFDGRYFLRYADGGTRYFLYERGALKDDAHVSADGYCECNDEHCAPDDPRLLALIAQVAPVEVRPAARAPHPPSSATRHQSIV